jgi:competence protein ComFC
MNKIINKIGKLIVDLFFPQNPLEIQATEIVANIAKIQCDEGDKLTKYPCPAYSFFTYHNDAVRAMIWRLKYRGDKTVAKLFAERMYDQLCEELAELEQWSNFRKPILVAIPVSKKKLRTRGFNQSVAICKSLTAIDENRFFEHNPNVLYKIKDTKSQARVKDKKSRLENLKDSFAIKDKSLVENKNIILLDDVLTTGSTLTEATRVLKNAGAKNIIWVVVAH